MKRPLSMKVKLSAKQIGEQLSTWRRLSGITSEGIADKAAVSRGTVSRLEHGDPSVSLGTFLSVLRAYSILDDVVDATDPYQNDYGQARADQLLPQRVRSPR